MDRSPNVTWHESRLSRARRWAALDASGATVWITGLPGAGKSTLGAAIEEALVEQGRPSYLLDGDNLRHGICGDLGFTALDRETNISRVGEIALMFADAGAVAVVALVSPYASARQAVRRRHETAALPFLEVFLDTPVAVCAARDPKGLYARARTGDVDQLTGVDDPYESPAQPDLRLGPEVPPSEALNAVLALLAGKPAEPKGATR